MSWPIRSFPNLRSKSIRAAGPLTWRVAIAILFLYPLLVRAADPADVRVVVPELPAQFDPHKAVSFVDRSIASELFQGLVTRDARGQIVPAAATWQISPDGLTYTFTLKDGLVWSDGKPVTAGDFVAGISNTRVATGLTIEAPDTKTVKITMARSSVGLLEKLGTPEAAPLPRHRRDSLGNAWAERENLVTNGPARLRVDNVVSLTTSTANIVFRIAPSAEEAAALVRDGAADLTLGFGFENPSGLVAAPFLADPAQNLYGVTVNTTRAPLNIREVRHALGMAIDRDEIVKAIRIENASPAYAMAPPATYGEIAHGSAAYAALRPDMRGPIAEVLLGEHKIDSAHPVTFSLIYPKGAVHAAVAKNLAAAWAKMGVHTRPQEQDMADYLQSLRDGAFDLALAVGESTDTRPLGYLTPFLPLDPANIMRYAEEDFAERMRVADAALDPAHHLVLLSEAEAILIEDQPVLPIFFFPSVRPVAAALKGWAPAATSWHPLHALSR